MDDSNDTQGGPISPREGEKVTPALRHVILPLEYPVRYANLPQRAEAG